MRGEPPRCRRAAYAAAVWSALFAVRGAYWALGGSVGLATLSSGIREAHDSGDPYLFAALWVTVLLELVGIWLALVLAGTVRPAVPWWSPVARGLPVPTWVPVLAGSGAGGLLIGHGGFFVLIGIRAAGGAYELTSVVLWYSLFWGPWFMTGGVLFALAARCHLARCAEPATPARRTGAAAAAIGFVSGLGVAAAPVVVTALASAA